ncbi:hypothetical protein H7347_06180 [Corynebacterium sp. zg-331]|uniref:hypothetical protein n=1 Tax=unclassified Corynebacterium TaxID=2624378 RepID=UPI00128E67BF|nr:MULTISPECIES: hypothetical protein [unclassified Corynebacterium]MBC3186162.1 hypothetical protein [Corynebacterium sp. zg-331]MPV52651.1 hypothetical protein [Corynebacterium sp. zg331]
MDRRVTRAPRRPRSHRRLRAQLRQTAWISATALLCASCSAAEPENPDAQEETPRVVHIVAASDSIEQQALAHLYRLAMAEENVVSTVETRPGRGEEMLEWLRDPGVDMVVGCTGVLLGESSPHQAEELNRELADTDLDSQEAMELTYETVMGTLGYEYGVPDPSPAQGCAVSTGRRDALPRNILPVFRKLSVGREGFKEMNRLTRLITTHDVETLVEDAVESGDVAATAERWYRENATI